MTPLMTVVLKTCIILPSSSGLALVTCDESQSENRTVSCCKFKFHLSLIVFN